MNETLAEDLAKAMVERLNKFKTTKWGEEALGLVRTEVLTFLIERFPRIEKSALAELVSAHVKILGEQRLEADFDAIAARVVELGPDAP